MQPVFMRRVLVGAVGILGGLIQGQAFAEPCANAYEKSIPYSQGQAEDHAKIDLHNTVTLRYDCKAFSAESAGGIRTKFFGVDAQLIESKVAVISGATNARLTLSALVLGYEVAHEETTLSEVYRKTFRPDQDLDVAKDATLQVGPLTVPVRYGVQGRSTLSVAANLRNLGAELTVTPAAKANAYLLAGVDVKLVKGSARGDVLLIDGGLTNNLGVHFSPKQQAPTIDFSAVGDVAYTALDGTVTASVQVPQGNSVKTYQRELFRWAGYSRADRLYDHSETIASLPN